MSDFAVNLTPPAVQAVTLALTSQAGPALVVDILAPLPLTVAIDSAPTQTLAVNLTPPALQSVAISLAAGPKGDPGEPGAPGKPGAQGEPGPAGTGKIWVDLSLSAYTALSDAVRLDSAYVYNVTP